MPIWMDIVNSVLGTAQTVLPYITQRGEERRSQERAKELMDIQVNHQKDLNAQGQGLQLGTWQATNYPNQVKMIKEAGLNPALLYGKGGGGGATTGSQSGGSASIASGGYAPLHYMDLQNTLQTMANIKLIQAEINKTEAEKRAIEAGIPKTGAETKNIEANTAYTEVKTETERINAANRQYQITAEVNNVAEQTNKLKLENALTKEQFEDIVTTTKNNAVGTSIRNSLESAKIKLTDSQIKEIQQSIEQKWAEIRQKDVQLSQTDTQLGQKQREISQKDSDIIIEKFKADTARKYPSIINVAGGIVQGALNQLENIGRQFNTWVFDISKDEVNPYQK